MVSHLDAVKVRGYLRRSTDSTQLHLEPMKVRLGRHIGTTHDLHLHHLMLLLLHIPLPAQREKYLVATRRTPRPIVFEHHTPTTSLVRGRRCLMVLEDRLAFETRPPILIVRVLHMMLDPFLILVAGSMETCTMARPQGHHFPICMQTRLMKSLRLKDSVLHRLNRSQLLLRQRVLALMFRYGDRLQIRLKADQRTQPEICQTRSRAEVRRALT